MNIVQENTGVQEAVLQIRLSPEDYRDRVAKELKNMQKKAQMPGFRPGKVPYGMIQKMYGKSVLVEEVNKVLSDAIYNYIKDHALNILGHPLASQQDADGLDWDKPEDFTFTYHIGLAPEFELDMDSGIEVDYHSIRVSDDMVESYLTDLRKRYGKMSNPEVSGDDDILFGLFEELESEDTPKAEGKTHKSSVYIRFIADEALKASMIGAKPGDQFVMDIMKATGSESEAASMVGVKKEDLLTISPLFRFTIEQINRIEPADMDDDFFSKVAPDQSISDEEGLRALLREQIGMQYQQDVDKHFVNEVRKTLIEKTDLPLPDAFLKKWLLEANHESFTEEDIDKEFDKLKDTFRWQLIENHLVKKYNLQVTPQQIHDHLESYFRAQMKQYGQEDLEKSVIDGFIRNITSKQEEVKKVEEHLYDQKMLALFREKLILRSSELSFEDFVKLVTASYEK